MSRGGDIQGVVTVYASQRRMETHDGKSILMCKLADPQKVIVSRQMSLSQSVK